MKGKIVKKREGTKDREGEWGEEKWGGKGGGT